MVRKAISEKAQATKKSILEAAAHILLKEGIDAASTNRIAEKAGVSIGSLYQYYSDKDEIFEELIRDVLDARQARVQEALSLGMVIGSTEDTLVKIIDVVFEERPGKDAELETILIPLMLSTKSGRRMLERAETFENLMKPIIKALILLKEPKLAKKDLNVVIYILSQTLRGNLFGLTLRSAKGIDHEVLKAELKHLLLDYLTNLAKR